jgi:hypothetical protein
MLAIKQKLEDIAYRAVGFLYRFFKLLPPEFFAKLKEKDETGDKLVLCFAAYVAALSRHDLASYVLLHYEVDYLVQQYNFRKAELNQIVHEQWWS